MFIKQNNHLKTLSRDCEKLKTSLPAVVAELLQTTEVAIGRKCIFTTVLRAELRARNIPYRMDTLYPLLAQMGLSVQSINIPLADGGWQRVRVWGDVNLCRHYTKHKRPQA